MAFNYVVSKPGEEIVFDTSRDVFRVREVLTINANIADLAILQLIDHAGNPIEDLDPRYVPVPLWESDVPPPEAESKQFRQAAAIGSGHRLPLKISMSRSFGWLTDPTFLGINFYGDIFGGNSGGGMYDVETGTLVGVVSHMQTPLVALQCPDEIEQGPDAWPLCKKLQGGEARPLPWNLVPAFDFTDPDNPVFQNCSQWAPNDIGPEERDAIEEFMADTFTLGTADLSSPPDGVKEEALVRLPSPTAVGGELKGVITGSIKTLRELACGPANSSQPFLDAVRDKAASLFTTKASIDQGNCKYPDLNDTTLDNDNAFACPSLRAIADEALPVGRGAFAATFDPAEAAELLRESRLCKGTVGQPTAQTWGDLPRLRLEHGRETTLRGTTIEGNDYFANPDVDPAGPFNIDALYAVEVDEWTILYADTFSGGKDLESENPGTNFDTVLFLMEANTNSDDPSLLQSQWTRFDKVYDDSRCSQFDTDVDFYFQSQMTQTLAPGKKYILGITSYAGVPGNFNLHIQSAPGVRLGELIEPADAFFTFEEDGVEFHRFEPPGQGAFALDQTEEACGDQNGTFNPSCLYNVQPRNACEHEPAEVIPEPGEAVPDRGSGEYGLVTVACPLSKQKRFRFDVHRLDGEGDASDPVGAVWEGQRPRDEVEPYVCRDDSFENLTFLNTTVTLPSLDSDIGHPEDVHPFNEQMVLTSGAGLRVFYVHQYRPFMNWQGLGYSLKLPVDAVNDIWPEEE